MSMHAPVSSLPLFQAPEPEPEATRRPEWTGEQRRVYDELRRHHEGRGRAIRCSELAVEAGFDSERRLQAVIHQLITVHGIAVGSAMAEPFGYYLARTDAELDEVVRMFRDRAAAIEATGDHLDTWGRKEMERRTQGGQAA